MVIGPVSVFGIKDLRRLNRALKLELPPSGTYMMIDSGNCPSGWTEDTSFDGRYPLGANASLGTTGGSETYSHAHYQSGENRGYAGSIASGGPDRWGSATSVTWYPPYVKLKFCRKN